MQIARWTRLAGALAGGVVLLTACSDPAPTTVPSPAAGAPSVASPTTSAPSPTSAPPTSSAPVATPTTAAPSTRTAAPRPSSGSGGSVEPSRRVETAAPKKLDEPTKTAGAQVSLVSVRATRIKATSPGDSSGPGVLIRLRLVNRTSKTLDTGFVQVNVTNATGNPGTLVNGSPTRMLPGSLKKGASGEGTYAFLLANATSAPVTVSVYVTSGQPVVTFRGRAS